MADGKMSYWRRGLGWLVRLFLVLFIVLVASIWTDLVVEAETYDRLFGSEYACYLSKNYCSWSDYTLSLVPHSLLAIAAAVALAWRRLRRREAILNALAVMVLLFLAWLVIQARSIGYAE